MNPSLTLRFYQTDMKINCNITETNYGFIQLNSSLVLLKNKYACQNDCCNFMVILFGFVKKKCQHPFRYSQYCIVIFIIVFGHLLNMHAVVLINYFFTQTSQRVTSFFWFFIVAINLLNQVTCKLTSLSKPISEIFIVCFTES